MAKETTNDDLAGMIKEGFDEMGEKIEKLNHENKEEHKVLKRDMEEIKMKFAYTAWQIDVEELKKRVAVLEQKARVKRQHF